MKLLPQNPIYHQLPSDWKYINSSSTDIRKSFERELKRIALEKKSKDQKLIVVNR